MTENCKFRNAILSAFYNISQRNFGILLILWCSFKLWWNFCLDQNLVYNANGPLLILGILSPRLSLCLHIFPFFTYSTYEDLLMWRYGNLPLRSRAVPREKGGTPEKLNPWKWGTARSLPTTTPSLESLKFFLYFSGSCFPSIRSFLIIGTTYTDRWRL
jgi:hypothetical protein